MATGKSIIKNFNKDNGFEIIPRELLQHCDKKGKNKNGQEHGENGLSLQAIGLLVNLQSYPEDWELYKTELYKRYSKNGRRQVENAWNELVEHKYIVQFKKRVKQNYNFIYYFSVTPFDDETIKQIEKEEDSKAQKDFKFKKAEEENPDCSKRTVQNEQSKMNSSERTANTIHTNNNTQEHITDETDGHSEDSGKPIHKSHKNHSSSQDFEKDYYIDELPKVLRTTLKPFDIADIKIIKNLFKRALKEVNSYENIKTITENEVAFDINKAINKINIKRKKDYEETNTFETIEELKGFIYSSFRNAVIEYAETENHFISYTEDHREAFYDDRGVNTQNDNKGDREHIQAGEVKEFREMIESFRNS